MTAALRILIVDDEPLARLRLRGLVDAIAEPRCEVVAEAATGSQAAAWLRDHGCDLVLLDEEKSDHIMVCVSRAKSPCLVLDL